MAFYSPFNRGGNPLAAFLAGFRAVDQLETNRQAREFRAEQQSRLRTIWHRQDEEFERAELKRIQGERRQMFESVAQDVQNEIAYSAQAQYDKVIEAGGSQAEAEAAQASALNRWYGNDPDAERRTFGEILKRMQQADPSVGEHIALAHGIDPSAGRHVNNKTNPVANVGILPSSLAPSEPRMFFEVNSENGIQPITDNRSSDDNDRVSMVKPTMQGLVGFFGPEFMMSATPMSFRLRKQVESMQGGMGDPRAVPVTRGDVNAAQQPAPEPEPEPEPEPAPPGSEVVEGSDGMRLQDPNFDLEAFNAEVGGGGKASAVPPGEPDIEAAIAAANATLNDPNFSVESFQAQPEKGLGTRIGEEIQRQLPRVTGTRVTSQDAKDIDTPHEVGRATREVATYTGRILGGFLHDAWDALGRYNQIPGWVTAGSDFIRGVIGVESGGEDKVPSKAKDMPSEVSSTTLRSGTPEEITDATNKERPRSQAATQKAADSVVTASRSRRRVPFANELYNAALLMNAGMISQEEFQRFRSTGTIDKPLETTLMNVGKYLAVIQQDPNRGGAIAGINFIGGPGAQGSSLAEIKDQQALLNLYQDDTKGIFGDDERSQEQFISASSDALTLLGIPGNTEQDLQLRANAGVRNALKRGAAMLKGFDEDELQFIDLNPFSDFEPQFTAGNVALATRLAQLNVGEDRIEGMHAIRDYVKTLKPASRLSDAGLIQKATEIETTIAAVRAEAARTGEEQTIRIKGRQIVVTGDESLHEIREEVIDALLVK